MSCSSVYLALVLQEDLFGDGGRGVTVFTDTSFITTKALKY